MNATPTPSTTSTPAPVVGQLDLFAGLLPADTQPDQKITNPTCPRCQSALEVIRTYKGVDSFRVTALSIEGDAGTAGVDWDVNVHVRDEQDSDETIEVLDTFIACVRYEVGCDFAVPRDAPYEIMW